MPAASPRRERQRLLAAANQDGSSQHLASPHAVRHSHRVDMPGPPKKDNTPKRTLTVRLPVALIERLRRIARDAAGYPTYASMAGIVEAGVVSECDRIEKALHAAYPGAAAAVHRVAPGPRRLCNLNNNRVDLT